MLNQILPGATSGLQEFQRKDVHQFMLFILILFEREPRVVF